MSAFLTGLAPHTSLHEEGHIVTHNDLTGILVALVTPFTADGRRGADQ
jgi:hypothetical protein